MSRLFVYLQPGEWFSGDRPSEIATILGSCLGIVMRHRDGATCVAHCVLPSFKSYKDSPRAAQFVDTSLDAVTEFFDRRGISRSELDVKLFGGAQILSLGPHRDRRTPSVGSQNLEAALTLLRCEGIRISNQDVGGNRGRKIWVNSGTERFESVT